MPLINTLHLRPLCLTHIFSSVSCTGGTVYATPMEWFFGRSCPLGTSILWDWLTSLYVFPAPTPSAPMQENVTELWISSISSDKGLACICSQ